MTITSEPADGQLASPELCQALIQSSPDAVTTLTLCGALESMNDSGLRLLEISDLSRVTGCEWAALWPADMRSRIRDAVARARTGPTARLRASRPTGDGALRWWDVALSAVPDASGAPCRLAAVCRDITEFQQAFEAAAASEGRFRLMAENTTDIIVRGDMTGTLLYVSPSCRAYGYEPDELIGHSAFEHVHPDDLARITANSAPLLAGAAVDQNADRAHRFRTKAGDWVWLEGRPRLIRDAAGKAIEILNMFRDITERKAQEALFENAFHHAAIGMALVGLDGSFLKINSAFCGIVGYSEPVMLGLDFQTITHPDDLEADLGLLGRLLAGEIPDYRMDKRYIHADGSLVWVRLSVSLVLETDGRPKYFVAQVEDLTAHRAAEDRYRLLAENAGDMVSLHDLSGGFVYCSPSSQRLLGFTPEEMVGTAPRDFAPTEDLPALMEARVRMLEAEPGVPVQHLMRMRRKDGELIWAEVNARVAKGDDGAPIIVSATRDVSARIAVQEALEQKTLDLEAAQTVALTANKLMRTAEQVANMGYWTWDVPTGVGTWSEEISRILGLDHGDGPSFEKIQALRHPDDREAATQKFQAALTTGEAIDHDFRIILPSGETRNLLSRVIVAMEDGRPKSAFGVMMDITDQKRAEAAVRDSDARYRLIAENSTDMIVTTDVTGRMTFATPSCLTVTGYTPEELLGLRVTDFIHPDDLDGVRASFARLARGETGERVRWRGRHKSDDRWIWLESNPARLGSGAGSDDGYFVDVIRDVTAQVAQEEALAQATVAAEAATAVKSEFLANMSHEIRTPLTAVIGFTGLLAERQDLDDDARTQVQRVVSASRALLSIVNDILDFSKLEAGQYEIAPRPTSPVECARAALLMFEPQADAKGLVLDFVAEGELPAAVALDPDRFRQILLNLIGNAIKFTERGSVRLRLRHEAARLHVSVEDTGAGLTGDQRRQLFQRFSQVDASSTRRHGGTGLGLAICKGLVEAMGGEIGVRSRPGRGSSFFFSIGAPEVEAAVERGDGEAEAFSLDGVRVLVVDDNALNRELARAILQQLNAEVADAADGLAGLAAAQALPYDVILLDIRMPGLDGPATLARIRQEPGPNQDVPILAFSADADLQRFTRLGFDGVVAKPIDPMTLITAIAEAVQWNPQAGEGGEKVA
ncbi:MAG: PAS domain S-box protein [Phenylobacterium sp.]|uniref:PAS domain S-box protein n=1 Tax=Phenylobacterium sp. TaxID=1871053 RepID=UPI002732ADCA|nr:PAS domain S-box protein [Phenylobacterium sp.]MDP3747187.1 PAS domain S-box protein [Phenylobacterium sp.]